MELSQSKLKRRHRRLRRNKPKRWCCVYALKDFEGKIRYVGQTRLLLSERLKGHWNWLARDVRDGRTLSPCQKWLWAMQFAQCEVAIEAIDADGTWDISEAVWIDRLLRDGHDLTNVLSRVPMPA